VATLLLVVQVIRSVLVRPIRILSGAFMRSLILSITTVFLVAAAAAADPIDPSLNLFSTRSARDPWHLSWPSSTDEATPAIPAMSLAFPAELFPQDIAQPVHPAAIEHSHAYETRAKIHKYASFATLPLFAAELALGQSLDGSNDGKKGAHAAVGAGIVGLFGVNTVTGAWNMFGEGRQDTEGRTLRLVHGLLMMAADVGFVATMATAPSTRRNGAATFQADRATHRNLAIASVSVGTAGYLLMLFGNR
jgi:hypothetical protein